MSDRTTVESHGPERAGPRGGPVAPAGCCCCCCCCLHTVGGVVGAVMGSVKPLPATPRRRFNDDDDDDDAAPVPVRRDAFDDERPLPVTLLYWLLVLFLGSVTATLTYLNHPGASREPGVLLLGAFFAVMTLPGLQLGASVLTTIVVAAVYPEKSYPLRRVGWITLYSFLGAMIGIGVMAGCCGVLWLPGALR